MRVGSSVYLNSGSPKLKVVDVRGNNITVEWVDNDGILQSLTHPAVCFRLA
jgi:pyruvate kinase